MNLCVVAFHPLGTSVCSHDLLGILTACSLLLRLNRTTCVGLNLSRRLQLQQLHAALLTF